jgi:hypothetical protein
MAEVIANAAWIAAPIVITVVLLLAYSGYRISKRSAKYGDLFLGAARAKAMPRENEPQRWRQLDMRAIGVLKLAEDKIAMTQPLGVPVGSTPSGNYVGSHCDSNLPATRPSLP